MDDLDREFNELCQGIGQGIGCAPYLPEPEACGAIVPCGPFKPVDEPYGQAAVDPYVLAARARSAATFEALREAGRQAARRQLGHNAPGSTP